MESSALTAWNADTATVLARKSWTSYVGPVVLATLMGTFVIPFAWAVSRPIGVALAIATVSLVVLRVWKLSTYRLFFDDSGVWVFSGIFPWTRAVSGVKWRDLDEAIFFTGFWAWLFGSYDLRLAHRYTKSSEIVLTHMSGGRQAVERINELHKTKTRS